MIEILNNIELPGIIDSFAGSLFEFIKSIELTEIIYATVGAFLGFFFAFWADKRIDKHKRMQSINNIKEELLEIKDFIDSNVISNISPVIIEAIKNNYTVEITETERKIIAKIIFEMSYTLYTPIWDTVLYSGGIFDFKDEKYFNELIQIYNRINRLSKELSSIGLMKERDISIDISIIKQCICLSELLGRGKSRLSNLLYG